MSKKTKYYAVKKGHTTGIFESWDDCSKATSGFPGAEFKSFITKEEAEAYINGDDIYLKQVQEDINGGYIVAYTDGSFDAEANKYSYGICIIDKNFRETDLCAAYDVKSFDGANNIVGEVFGVIAALDWALSFGYSKIKIYHDYEGLGKWASGEWSANSKIAQFYVDKLLEKFIGVIEVEFNKVKGHSNNPYNNKADQLADLALKDGKKLTIKGPHSFVVTNFKKDDLNVIIQLIMEEVKDVTKEVCPIPSGEQITLKIGTKKTSIKLFDNGKLLVQGKPTIIFQMLLTDISSLLGTDNLIKLMGNAYRWTIKKKDVDNLFENLCYNLPLDYPINGITLIRQALINKMCYVESEDYGQYAFPALKALEGHIKYLMQKAGVIIVSGRSIGSYFVSRDDKFYWDEKISISKLELKEKLEKCYNFYNINRHTIFHFGDILGATDTTRMINTKSEADQIIDSIIKLINETV